MVQVDELLQTQFREAMQRIVDHCGKRREGGRQTVLVSATLSDKVGFFRSEHSQCLAGCVCVVRRFKTEGEKRETDIGGHEWQG